MRFEAISSRYFEYSRLKTRVRSSSKALSKFLSLRFLVLALHDDTGRDVRQADRRVGRIDRLSAGTRSAEDILADVVHRDFYVELLGFGQHGHRSGRGVDAALRFGLGYALHAVYARFVFERTIDIVARDFHHDLLVSAGRAFREGGDFVLPAFGFDVFGVHAHQVAGEDGGFVAARAAADLDDRVFGILRVLGNQQEFDLLFEVSIFGSSSAISPRAISRISSSLSLARMSLASVRLAMAVR